MNNATLNAKTINNALRTCGVRARNWSAPGALCLAIYTDGDLFIGCIESDGVSPWRTATKHTTKAQRAELERLCVELGRLPGG